MTRKTKSVLCAAALLLSVSAPAAQFVEVAAEFEITTWRYQEETGLPIKRSRAYSVRCVVGTNTWLIENHARTNATESVWFIDGKIVRQTTLNQAPLDQESAPSEPVFRSFRRGRTANVVLAPDGYPSGDMFLNLPWFAFCSGPYLARPGRSVPLPTPAQDRAAFGFAGETTLFTDSLGLPKRAAFYTTKRQLKCDYQVQQSTNVLGWTFPTAFTVVQNEPDALDQWHKQLAVSGRVTSIRPAKKPDLPEELRERVEEWEQSPLRK
jgi:hypothetical protein